MIKKYTKMQEDSMVEVFERVKSQDPKATFMRVVSAGGLFEIATVILMSVLLQIRHTITKPHRF